jgi:hypothetical protein
VIRKTADADLHGYEDGFLLVVARWDSASSAAHLSREWATVATSEFELSCCMTVRDTIYVGTDDARMLRLSHGGRVRLRTLRTRAAPETRSSADCYRRLNQLRAIPSAEQ